VDQLFAILGFVIISYYQIKASVHTYGECYNARYLSNYCNLLLPLSPSASPTLPPPSARRRSTTPPAAAARRAYRATRRERPHPTRTLALTLLSSSAAISLPPPAAPGRPGHGGRAQAPIRCARSRRLDRRWSLLLQGVRRLRAPRLGGDRIEQRQLGWSALRATRLSPGPWESAGASGLGGDQVPWRAAATVGASMVVQYHRWSALWHYDEAYAGTSPFPFLSLILIHFHISDRFTESRSMHPRRHQPCVPLLPRRQLHLVLPHHDAALG
jgi:hypothetical protein